MAGEEPRVAQAFIEIQARRAAAFREDIRRFGQEAGDDAGKAAGTRMADETVKGNSRELKNKRGTFTKDGEGIGRVLGEAAGKRAGKETADGVSEGLKNSRSSFVQDGESIGAIIGATAGRRAAAMTRAGVKRELAAETKALAAEAKARIAEAKAEEKAATAAARAEANQARDAAKAARDEAERLKARKQKFLDFHQSLTKIFSRGLIGGQGILGKAFSVAGIATLASSASGLGSILNGVVGAVISLSGAAALLPAAFAGAAIGAGALKIGISGVSDALSNSSDPKAYAASLKQLAPSAQSFVRAIVKLKPELRDLKKTIQEGLFKGLAKEIAPLGKTYIPLLSKGLTTVSTAFGQGAASVGTFLQKSSSAKAVSGIFGNVGKAAKNLSLAFKPAVSSLLTLVSTGSSFLPQLGHAIAGVATKFDSFLKGKAKSGALKDFMLGGITAIKELGKIALGVGRIVSGIFGAGAGANSSGLKTIADLLKRVGDEVNKPAFQKGLGDFFKAIASAGKSVGGALPAVATALIALEPALSKIVAGSGVAFAAILKTAAGAAVSLAPTLSNLAGIFQALAPHAGAIAIAFVGIKAGLLGLKIGAGVIKGIAAATKVWAAAQVLLDVAMAANPIGLTIAAIALLAVGLVIAYKKSEKFREVVQYVFKAVADTVLGAISGILGAFGGLFGVMGHLPGKAGAAFRSAAEAAKNAKGKVDDLRHAIDAIHSKKINIKVVTTEIQHLLKDPGYQNYRRGERTANGGFINPVRRIAGGLIDPSLGGPRQDNVPLLVSGGEFVVNEFATSRPGVKALLTAINNSNQLPTKLATGGQVVGRAYAGMGDLSASKPARMERMAAAAKWEPASTGPTRLHPDDIAALGAVFERAMRQQQIVLDTGELAGSVLRKAGTNW